MYKIPIAISVLVFLAYVALLHWVGSHYGLQARFELEIQVLQEFALTADSHQQWLGIGFFSYAFMHGAWWHLLMNMLVLSHLGRVFERLVNDKAIVLAFYMFSGVFVGILHWAYTNFFLGEGRSQPMVGYSGVLYAMLAIYVTNFTRQELLRFLFALFGIPALIVYLTGLPLSLSGHFFGFVVGLAFQELYVRTKYRGRVRLRYRFFSE